MNLRRAAWKVFSLHQNELYFAVPLFALYFLSGAFYTLGQIYAETRFLKNYGAGAFSYFFILNGILLIAAGILYSTVMLKIPLRRGYVLLVSLSALSIMGASIAAAQGWAGTHFYVYTVNYLFTFFLDIHFFNFAFIHLNLSNSKRILPFLMAGGKLGGILVSLMIFWGERSILLDYGIYFWGAAALLLMLPIGFLRSARVTSAAGSIASAGLKTGIIKKIERKTALNLSAPLFKITALSVFIMAALNQTAEYYFAGAFNRSFDSEEALAGFLSIYTFSADIITLTLQFAFVSRIISSLGVQRSNYIYPSSFIIFLTFFIVSPGLAAGVMLRFFRKNISVIIRTPVFNIILSALPRSGMAEAKSAISGVIAPAGMIAGGALIYIIDSMQHPAAGYIICSVLGIWVLYLSLAQNRSYINSIRLNLSAGITKTVAPPQQPEDFNVIISSAVRAGFDQKAVEDLFNESPSPEGIIFLYDRYETLSLDTRRALLSLISCVDHPLKTALLIKSANDPYIEIRSMTAEIALSMTQMARSLISAGRPEHGISKNESFVFNSLNSSVPPQFNSVEIERLDMMKKLVLSGRLSQHELLMRTRIYYPENSADIIYETALETGDPLFLNEIAKNAALCSRDKIRRLIYRFKDQGAAGLYLLLERSPSASPIERVLMLDLVPNIPEEKMLRLFPFGSDEKTDALISGRIKKDLNLFRLENCLNYFMTFGITNSALIRGFIDAQLAAITIAGSLTSALNTLQGPAERDKKNSIMIRFLSAGLDEVIESRKRLILKAAALETGIHLDRVYESNLLVKDRDLNACLFEFIDSHSPSADKITALFSENRNPQSRHAEKNLNPADILEEARRAVCFIPETADLIRALEVNRGEPDSEGSGFLFTIKNGGDNMLDIMEKILYLKETGIFRDLKPGELIHIARVTEQIEIPAGKYIIRQGESGDELFIITDGEVDIFKENRPPERLGPGSSLGELSIIEAEPRTTNVITRGKTRLLCLKRKDFLLTLKQNPAISINVMKILTERLRNLSGR